MARAASRTLLALFVTFCASRCGWTAEKPLRSQNGKQTAVDKVLRESWQPSIHLDGRPVDRFVMSSSKPSRSHRFTKLSKDTRSHPPEDVDPEIINLDGFAVLVNPPVNTSAGLVKSSQTAARNHSAAGRTTRVNRTARPAGLTFNRMLRRAPQSSSGPRQPESAVAGTPLLERRRQRQTKPQADQRNRPTPKLASESVHVVSLQAQKAQGRSAPANRDITAKTTPPEPPEYEARDISVRVISPKSVLISWVDPAVEMGKVAPGASRSYTVRFREKGESARWEYKESTQRRMMIDTLSADGMYEFSVRISQGEKHSKWSVSVFQRTPESAPSGPPEDFEVKPLRGKGTAVIATWDPPEEPNGRITEYILSYAPAMKPFGMKSVTYRGGTTTATIDGLTPGERYIFKIRAANRRGMGPQSKVFSVVMPQSRSAVSSFSETKDSHMSKQDEDKEKPNPPSKEVPEEPTATPKPKPVSHNNRRVRPLSQTRSYHSIFSSVRGSVRNGLNRGSSKGKAKEDEEQEEEKVPTTPPPVEETTIKVMQETEELDNDVSLLSEDEVGYIKEPVTTETPSLKVFTPSPTKPVLKKPYQPNRRPVKIRVHQKAGSKATSSSSSNNPSSSSSASSSPSSSATSSFPSSRIQESAASRKDHVVSAYPNTQNIYNRPNVTQAKPSTTGQKESNSQQTDTTPMGTGSSSAERSSGSASGFPSRHGFSRRHPGISFRGNTTRLLNGYKPAVTTQLKIPSRTQSQVSLNPRSSASSQSILPERTQSHETSSTFIPKTSTPNSGSTSNSHSTSDSNNSNKSQFTSNSRSQDAKILKDTHSSTSQRRTIHHSTGDKPGSSQSTSQRAPHSSVTSRDTHNSLGSHTSPDLNTSFREGNDDSSYKHEEDKKNKVEEPTSSSRAQPTVQNKKEERKDESVNKKPTLSRTRISSSFAEKIPWLASRYPGKFVLGTRASSPRQDGGTSLTRVSSSVGAGRPLVVGTPTRVSGAAGVTGESLKQETTEDLRTLSKHDSLKNSVGVSSVKPSLNNQNTRSSDSNSPTTSFSSSASTFSNSGSNPLEKTTGHKDSSDSNHKEISNSDTHKDNIDARSRENKEKAADHKAVQRTPTSSSAVHRNGENEESMSTRETSSRTRTGISTGASPSRRLGVGMNGRVRSSLLANTQFGGSRLPIRPQQVQNSRLGGSTSDSSSSLDSSASLNFPKPVLNSAHNAGSDTTVKKPWGGNSPSTSSSSSIRNPGGRARYPIIRGKPNNGGGFRPGNGNGKDEQPNLTATNAKETSSSLGTSKATGQKFITGPDGTKWVVDLERGVLMNQDGKILQDSQGKPKRVVLGEDGRTIFDHMGSPLVSQEGIALFGHGRDSQPVVNPKEKVLTVGGKPVLGLNVLRPRTSITTTTTAPPTTSEPTTTEWTTEEFSTALPYPTCPPGTFSKTDEYGYPLLDPEGILDCYPEEDSSGMEMDHMLTVSMVPDALALEKVIKNTLPPSTTTTATTSTTTTTTVTTPDSRLVNKRPLSEFDLSGKKRFTAPYVNYIQKDPGAPCSLTEALEYLQVDILEDVIKKDMAANQNQPPKHKPHNLTVVAMEGCHSFIILDWARPLKDDMVSGYMVYSASYDDVLNNRWSPKASDGTHLAVENLKPNSRYYFKVRAKNVFGLGPFSETLTYETESDDPFLIERPPGGEPIWVPFTFKYNPVHSSCKGSQFVKRTWYRKFVGVVLCNSLRYKIFMGDGLREPFYSIGDTLGQGEDHCQFVDSYRDGRTGPSDFSYNLPSAQGYYRAYRQEPVTFGVIGRRTAHHFVGWYECGVPIPGKW
ncbi:fibronectin type III domain-containing protein 1 isoform X3 [Kryptolebias marmoratus]|uniref:fibronectin type III domain-containing protein 1 isoform X3 n=1 Tax=Kryptolebias marmoratus TaxID=37003 RepID=UPI0007F9420F|nr:fibronectin type III domain-containing protein 1 isoform X3 [Kryptolebias marmoratus]